MCVLTCGLSLKMFHVHLRMYILLLRKIIFKILIRKAEGGCCPLASRWTAASPAHRGMSPGAPPHGPPGDGSCLWRSTSTLTRGVRCEPVVCSAGTAWPAVSPGARTAGVGQRGPGRRQPGSACPRSRFVSPSQGLEDPLPGAPVTSSASTLVPSLTGWTRLWRVLAVHTRERLPHHTLAGTTRSLPAAARGARLASEAIPSERVTDAWLRSGPRALLLLLR